MTSLAVQTLAWPDEGPPRAAGSNAPLLLDDPSVAWRVHGGSMDIFAVPVRRGVVDGPREFLFQVEPGTVLPGFGFDQRGRTTLMAVGGAETRVQPIAMTTVEAVARSHPDQVAPSVDVIVGGIAQAIARITRRAPRTDHLVDEVAVDVVAPGALLGVRRAVRWVTVQLHGLEVLDTGYQTVHPGDPPFPLGPGLWLQADEEGGLVDIAVSSTATLLTEGQLWPALRAFQAFAVEWAARARVTEEQTRIVLLRERVAADAGTREEALSGMGGLLSRPTAMVERTRGIPLVAAMELVGRAQGITFRAPLQAPTARDPFTSARAIAESSSVGCRRVRLEAEWWTREVGPLLGMLEMRQLSASTMSDEGDDVERVPVALLPVRGGGYTMINPEDGTESMVRPELVRHLAPFAMQFHRGLPSTPVRLLDLWRFVTQDLRGEASTLVFVGLLGALLGFVLPLLSGHLFDNVIPGADRGALVMIGFALAVATGAGACFEITRTTAVIRLHTKLTNALQLAIIDRVIRLPATFFRGFSAGDLGQRAMGIQTIGLALSGQTLSALLSSVVACSALILLLHYSVLLALSSIVVLLCNIGLSLHLSRRSLRIAREEQRIEGALSGLLLELLRGIPKLRVAAAESRAFARWSTIYRQQQQLTFSVGTFLLQHKALLAVLEVVSIMSTYGLYSWMMTNSTTTLTTGEFLAFAAAQGSFVGAGLALSGAALELLDLLPTWERVKPLLDAVPEASSLKPDPGVLTGHIEISQLRFSYEADGPRILDDVSLTIAPGTFVALVGPSGSGKSTLMRLLLGFEKPSSGSVRYDGQELSAVDVSAVRRQIGVVLQHAALTAGDIYSNIVGAAPFSVDEAWEAARLAGMEDDLRAMPMGLHTVVSEGGGTLSGGQRQRLLIARSLVGKPRLLFFDEATSALDNHTQRIVSESVERLQATRVVVAHRLSTVRHADRIVVLDKGRIVEQGTYDELMARQGMFAAMAARQAG